MKNKLHHWAIMALFIFQFHPLLSQDPFEPNETYEGSPSINCNVSYLAFIQENGDKDWYNVTLPESGILKVTLTSVPTNLDLHVEIHQLIGNVLTKITNDIIGNASGGQDIFANAVVAAGTYFILVEDESNNMSSGTDSYDMLVSCKPNGFELNQIYEDAALIPSDTCFEENIFGFNYLFPEDNDVDWFKVNLSEPGVLKVALTSVPSALDINVTIYELIGGVLTKITNDTKGNATGGDDIFAYAVVASDSFLISVEDEGNNGNVEETYNFCVEFKPNQLELNQIYEDAAPIPADTCFEANIFGFNYLFPEDNDVDWFEVTLDEPGVLEVALTSVPSIIDLNVAVYQVINNVLTKITNDNTGSASGGQDIFANAVLAAGTYLIVVEDENDNGNTEETFSFCVEFTPNDLELNQLYEDAAAISTDTCFEANIYGFNYLFPEENDIDWFEIQVVTTCTLNIDITSVPTDVDLNLALYQVVNNVLTLITDDGGSASGGQDRFLDRIIDPGTYLILVEDENDNDNVEDTYNICVSCNPMTGVSNTFSESIAVFPNPSGGRFYVEGVRPGASCKVFDASGQMLLTPTCGEGVLELGELPTGVYFLQLTDGHQVAFKKVIID